MTLNEWASTFDNITHLLYRLESKGNGTGLYMTKERYGNGVPCYMYTSPVYHVWIDNKWVLATMNYHEAYERWREEA